MKKIVSIISALLVLMLGFFLTFKTTRVNALEDAKLFQALNVSNDDINSNSVCLDPFYPASLDSNTAGKGTPVSVDGDIPLAGSDGFIIRIKNLDNNAVLTRLLIRTTNDGFSATNSIVTFYDMEGNKTVSDKPSYRGVNIPALFDGVMVIEWSELVPFQKNGGADDWSIAVPENKLVKGSEGNTAYPTDSLKSVGFYVEKSAAHATVNPIVFSNVYTFAYADENYTVTKYANPWKDLGSGDNGGIYKYPTTSATLLEAIGEAGKTLDSTATCIDPLDPVAADSNTSGKGGIIGIYSPIYFGASDGLVFRVKNPVDTELATRIYIETTDGTEGNGTAGYKNGYTTNEVQATFIDLEGNAQQKNCTGRAVSILANFDGFMVLPWSAFTAYKYNGTTAWGNATTANQLVKGGEGQRAYPNGIITAISLYVHKKASHTTANIDPIIFGDVFAYTQGESSYTLIKKHAPFNPNASTNAAGNLSIYAYPTAKQTYNFTIDGVSTLDSENATITGATQAMEVAYGDKISLGVTPKDGASIVGVTLDGVTFDTTQPFINFTKEAGTHTINVVTARETLYSFEMTGNLDRVNVKVNDAEYNTALYFVENASVEIELTPKDGFKISSVKVNGSNIELVDGKYTFSITANTQVAVEAKYQYNVFNNPANVNSELNGDAMLFDPGVATGNNQGGNIFSLKKIELEGTHAIAFRVKNLENFDYTINTIYIQCLNDYSYSLYGSTLKYISLDGSVVETTMASRQAKVPANFDGYMVIDYNQLVVIRSGGAFDWSKRDGDKISAGDYPTQPFSFLSIYFNKNCEGVDEIVFGSDVYTIVYGEGSVEIRQYTDALNITGNSIANTVSVKNYPTGKVTITTENENVTIEKATLGYAETLVVTPKEGYTIINAKLGDDNLADDGTGVFKLRIAKDYGASAQLTVEASQLTYHNVTVQANLNQANVKVQDTEYTQIVKFVADSHVVVEVSAKEGFVVTSVLLNGEVQTLTENKFEFDLSADAVVTVVSEYVSTTFEEFKDVHSALTSSSIVFDPEGTEGSGNQGGTVPFAKNISLKGADALAFRVKNLESDEEVVNTLFLHLTNNWSYSIMGATIKWVALDGTVTENSMTLRQFKVPANFDGYMVIEFSELVPVRTGGDYDWSLRDDAKISKENYPQEALVTIGIFFPFGEKNVKANEIVFGTDVYLVYHGESSDTIKQFTDALKMEGHTLVNTVKVSHYIPFESNLTCDNTNVEVNLTKFSYGDTIVVTPKQGFIIESAKIGDEDLVKEEDGTYTFEVKKAYDENVVLTVVATSVTIVTFNVGENVQTSLNVTELKLGEENNQVEFTLTFERGYELDYIKLNGVALEAQDGTYRFNATQDSTVEIQAKLSVYTITYNLDGGTNNSNNRTEFTINDSFSLFDPTKEGYEFLGWYVITESDAHEDIVRIPQGTTKNLEVYALWEKVDTPVDPVTQPPVVTTKAPQTTTKAPDKTTTEAPKDNTPSDNKKGCKNALVPSILGVAFLLGSIVVIKRKREE